MSDVGFPVQLEEAWRFLPVGLTRAQHLRSTWAELESNWSRNRVEVDNSQGFFTDFLFFGYFMLIRDYFTLFFGYFMLIIVVFFADFCLFYADS